MTFATDLYSYFSQNISTLSLPSKISVNNIPSDYLECLAIYDTGGFSPSRYHGSDVGEHPTAQIRLRMKSSQSAYSVIYAIYSALDDKTNITIGNTKYSFIFASNPPVYMGVTDSSVVGKAYEYTLNLYSSIMRS